MEKINEVKGSFLHYAHNVEEKLMPFFAKFPHLPEGGRKVVAEIIPWVTLIFAILGAMGLLFAGGIMALLAIPSLLTGNIWIITGFITTLIGLLITVLEFLAFNPLKAHMKKGWNYLFYGLLLSALSTIVSVVGTALAASVYSGPGAINALIMGAIGFIIGGWVLFEIRDHFKA